MCYAINKKYSVLNSVKEVCMKNVNRKGLCEKLLFNLKLVVIALIVLDVYLLFDLVNTKFF